MTTIYFAGGEDQDHFSQGTGASVSTTSGAFRSTYSRCALSVIQNQAATYWQNSLNYNGAPSTFWFNARIAASNAPQSNFFLMKFADASNFVRLQTVFSGGAFLVQKVNTAGTATTLTNTLGPWTGGFSGNTGGTDRLAINWVNAASGTLDIYLGDNHVYNFSGDTTTETTAISQHRLYCHSQAASSNWSEVIVSDTDTRSWNLQTLAPVANGNTHNFDVGSPQASNVNEITLNDATLDGATTAGLIDQYTIPAIAGGTYTIMAVGVSARMQKGSSGPSKMDLNVRSGGTDYFSADQTLTTAWANYQNWWTTDPNTSATWAALPSNIGLKSVT